MAGSRSRGVAKRRGCCQTTEGRNRTAYGYHHSQSQQIPLWRQPAMNALDLSFVESARALEVDAMEGGRPLNEFTIDPQTSINEEEVPVLGRSVDDAEE